MDFVKAKQLVNEDISFLDDCIDVLLRSMTLKEKIYMLSGHGIIPTLKNIIKYGRPYNGTALPASGCKRLNIPKIMFTDGPRGIVMRKCTCFPVSMSRGAAFDTDLEKRIGEAMAREASHYGANYFAGICINLLRHPAWGRAQETYSEDQYLLGRMGVELTRAMVDAGIIACPKHYALNSIENLRFEVNAVADEKTLHDVYLPHFKACIDAGAMSIMGAYNKVNGDYACENKYLLKDVLRDMWGFKGFASSDFMWGVYDAVKSISSGMDLEMPFTVKYGKKVEKAINEGALKIEDIDWCVSNILRVLLTKKDTVKYSKCIISYQNHIKLALEAAEKGMVLLKNEDNILPLHNGGKVAVIGRYSDKVNIGDRGSSRVFPKYAVTAYQGIKNIAGERALTAKNRQKMLKLASECETVVITVGTDYRHEGEYILNGELLEKGAKLIGLAAGGDRKNLRIPSEDVNLIKEVSKVNSNIIVVIYGGSGFIINEWSDMAKGIIINWYSGMEGGNALGNIIYGKVNPSGKLPLTIAKDESDYPEFLYKHSPARDIEYGYYHGYALMDKNIITPDYPFGYGLSYTTYKYSSFKVTKKDKTIVARVSVTNEGKMAGEEIVQLYAGSTAKDRPVKLLKGFTRVFIKPGETIIAEIKVPYSDLMFFDPETKTMKNDEEYRIMIGASSSEKDLLTQIVRI